MSNAEGSCAVLVHSDPERNYGDLAFQHNQATGVFNIVYHYEQDEADTRDTGSRPNIRVIQFTVSPDGDNTKINEALPLAVNMVWRYSRNSSSGRGILRNDIMGNSIVFSLEYGEAVGTKRDPRNEWFAEIRVIEDIDQCIADAGAEPDESCATLAFAASTNRAANNPVWGLDANRIYFGYDWEDPRDSNHALAFIDRTETGWSPPGAVRLASDTPTEEFNLVPVSVAPRNFGAGVVEALTILVNDTSQIFDIDSACTAQAATSNSCYSQGLMGVLKTSPDFELAAYWSAHPTIGSEPNLVRVVRTTAENTIRELEPVSEASTDVITGLPDGIIRVAPDDAF